MISTFGLLMSLNDPQWGNRGGNDKGQVAASARIRDLLIWKVLARFQPPLNPACLEEAKAGRWRQRRQSPP